MEDNGNGKTQWKSHSLKSIVFLPMLGAVQIISIVMIGLMNQN
jgi:hypothetical protein